MSAEEIGRQLREQWWLGYAAGLVEGSELPTMPVVPCRPTLYRWRPLRGGRR